MYKSKGERAGIAYKEGILNVSLFRCKKCFKEDLGCFLLFTYVAAW